MAMPKISVIVPVYNVGNYLYECLDSIVNQTIIDNLEVIIVDDGSTDKSRYVVEKYAQDFDNFYAYHKSNGGLGNARNFGLKFAKGEYIYFIDSDDYIPPDTLEKMYNLAKKHNHDMITGNFIRFDEDSTWKEEIMYTIFQDIPQDIEKTHFRQYPILAWDVAAWNKLFKREFLEKHEIRFPDQGLFEDNIVTMKSHYLSNSIGILSDNIYYWRFRKNSLTEQSAQLQHVKDATNMIYDVYRFMQSNIEEEDIKKMIFNKFLNIDFHTITHRIIEYDLKQEDIINAFIEIIKLIPDDSINDLNTYRRLLVRMLENKDYENISYVINNYARLVAKSEQEVLDNIDEGYLQYINVKQDLEKSRLTVSVNEINPDDENITLLVYLYRLYCPKHDYQSKAKLITGNESIELKIIDNKKIILPLDLIKGEYSKIKVEYYFNDICKEAYVQFKNNMVFNYDNFDICLNSGNDYELNVLKREKNQNNITIEDIIYDENNIIIKGKSDLPIRLFLENNIDFDTINIPTEFETDNEFKATINYIDLIRKPVKKWKLKTDLFNSIRLVDDNQSIYFNIHKINFYNNFNEISIECQLYDKIETINSLNEKLFLVEQKNKKLSSKNRKIRKTLNAYKSRKVVKFADKLKSVFLVYKS